MSRNRTFARACALPAVAALVVLSAVPAAAHVSISPEGAAAGSYAVLTAGVPHGCDGSPTTEVAIQMPEQILAVTPTRNPLWDVEKVMEELDEPVTDAHGNEITERVSQVVYSAKTPLPDGYRDAFELSLKVPDAEGETLVFPVVQTCEEGEAAWVETSADGSDDELDFPAPTLTVLPAEGDGHGSADTAASDETTSAETEPVAATTGGDGNLLGVAGLVAGLLGLAAGFTALVMVRRRS
jgi:periplasmic copper chaperone A